MRPARVPALLALLACAAALSACGKDGGGGGPQPQIGKSGGEDNAAQSLGFPAFATKNTTRVGGSDPTADAAAVALATYPGRAAASRPGAVTLVDSKNWQAGVAAAVLMSPPVRAPLLLSEGNDLPDASQDALNALDPQGSKAADDSEVIRVGEVAAPGGYEAATVSGKDPAEIAANIDALQTRATGKPGDTVLVTTSEEAGFAMPAAAWAAKSGQPVLYVGRNDLPAVTAKAIRTHQQPKIYVLGPPSVISEKVLKELQRLGTVKRIAGLTPEANAIAFSRFADGNFGWGIVNPGHGLVFANVRRPLDAAAAAPLSASGTYGPLLLVSDAQEMPPALVQYLLDIQPGFREDPVRGVYNHGWVIGDEDAISVAEQSRIDALLEIVPVEEDQPAPGGAAPGGAPPGETAPRAPAPRRTTPSAPRGNAPAPRSGPRRPGS